MTIESVGRVHLPDSTERRTAVRVLRTEIQIPSFLELPPKIQKKTTNRLKAIELQPVKTGSDAMFGKPDWFRKKRFGWGLSPKTWQGWIYALVWCVVLVGPFHLLLWSRGIVEAMIWLSAAIGALTWDVRLIIKEMDRIERNSLHYIGDDESGSHVRTANFDFHTQD